MCTIFCVYFHVWVWCVQLASVGVTSHVVCDPLSGTVIKCVTPGFKAISKKKGKKKKKSAEASRSVHTPSLFRICQDCDGCVSFSPL